MPPKHTTTKSKIGRAKRTTKAGTKKLDLYAKHKNEYVAGTLPAVVRVGPAKYLRISGRRAPKSDEFHRARGALYNVAFTIKMARKFAGFDYSVTKLEGLWWLDGAPVEPTPTTVWNWQLLLRVPPFISSRELYDTIDSLIAKGKS